MGAFIFVLVLIPNLRTDSVLEDLKIATVNNFADLPSGTSAKSRSVVLRVEFNMCRVEKVMSDLPINNKKKHTGSKDSL